MIGRIRKKQQIAKEFPYRKYAIRFDLRSIVWAPTIIKYQKYCFSPTFFSVNNLWSIYSTATILVSSCLSHRGELTHIWRHRKAKFKIWLQIKVTFWPKWVMLHISRCVWWKQTYWRLPHVSISITSKVIGENCDWPQVTSDDLGRCDWVAPALGSWKMDQTDVVMGKSQNWPDLRSQI